MIFTSYFAKLNKFPDNVIPIAICVKTPSWYNGIHYNKLVPSYDMFREWKETQDDDTYVERYNSEVLDKLDVMQVLKDIELLLLREERLKLKFPIQYNPVWHVALVCYEKYDGFCHRHLVSEWLRNQGVECDEMRL